jgi:hypothetical protein
MPDATTFSILNLGCEGEKMDPNLGSLVVAELVLSLIDEMESIDPGVRERLYARAIKKAREADHDRTADVVAALEAMRQGMIGS